eukprot:TRINITY_DN4530_c0_g1_i2.p1 TRINITY_DN4530_c0_g1~~TRINITY_DN4530_c0_g1_i2.p1  ORF type:complete len:235 (+),score=67.04 TRINITY_DN4530_c0_g1_i2:64-768(+)
MASFRPIASALRTLNQYHTKQLFYQPSRKNVFIFKLFQNAKLVQPFMTKRSFSSTPTLMSVKDADENDVDNVDDVEEDTEKNSEEDFIQKYLDPKDRSREIHPEISIKYMESVAFKAAYGDQPVWWKYRRNFPGNRLPFKTRETCIRAGKIDTGSPCPICRDEYLVIDYRNKALLKHFMDPYTGQVLPPNKTHICQKQWRKMQVHMEKAADAGFLDIDAPQVEYDYNEYIEKKN